MNNTIIQIKSIGNEVSAKTLQALIGAIFPEAEKLEEALNGQGNLEYHDELLWRIEVQGPERDYYSEGWVTHSRGPTQISHHKVNFHGSDLAAFRETAKVLLEQTFGVKFPE
ncbi:MAG: hypothetical protein Q7S57_01955 [bacterium]|nr:hypothetical protein [bacterium]